MYSLNMHKNIFDMKKFACILIRIHCGTREPGSIPGLERFPGEGYGNPLQDSCLGKSMDIVAWHATVHEVA